MNYIKYPRWIIRLPFPYTCPKSFSTFTGCNIDRYLHIKGGEMDKLRTAKGNLPQSSNMLPRESLDLYLPWHGMSAVSFWRTDLISDSRLCQYVQERGVIYIIQPFLDFMIFQWIVSAPANMINIRACMYPSWFRSCLCGEKNVWHSLTSYTMSSVVEDFIFGGARKQHKFAKNVTSSFLLNRLG